MFAARVVESVDVLKEGVGDMVSCDPSVPPDQFGLEGFEEGEEEQKTELNRAGFAGDLQPD